MIWEYLQIKGYYYMVKEIIKGESYINLSEEEAEALKLAVNGGIAEE